MCAARYEYKEVENIYKYLREWMGIDIQKTNDQMPQSRIGGAVESKLNAGNQKVPGVRLCGLRRRGISPLRARQRGECVLSSRCPGETFGWAGSRANFNVIHW